MSDDTAAMATACTEPTLQCWWCRRCGFMDDGWMDQSDQKHWCAQGCLQQLLFARRGAVLVCLCLTSRYYLRSIVHPTRSDGRREPFRNLHLFRWDREQVFAARTAREPFFCGGGRFGDVNGGWFRASSARWRMRTVARRAPSCLASDGSRSRWCAVERLLDVYPT
jgi:hypothetical protein